MNIIQRYNLWRRKQELIRLIDAVQTKSVDESFRCMRKHETYEKFKEEFHPISHKLSIYENRLKLELKMLNKK